MYTNIHIYVYIYIHIFRYIHQDIFLQKYVCTKLYTCICMNDIIRKQISILHPMCKKNKGYLVHNSDAISIVKCAFDRPCFLHRGPEIIFP